MTRNQVKSISNNDGEMLLFHGIAGCCYNCNKVGHRANEFPTKNCKESKFKPCFQGKCGTCGLRGHISKDYWIKEESKDKRPENWK